MSKVEKVGVEDEPLDPQVEAIRVKLVRLLMVSGGIMMMGLAAVIIAIFYKYDGGGSAKVAALTDLTTPAGSAIISASGDGKGVMLVLRTKDGTSLIQRHDADGTLLARYRLLNAAE